MGRPSSGWEQLKLPSEQGTCPLSPHRSAASIFEVRCCLAQRCQDRSIAYVAADGHQLRDDVESGSTRYRSHSRARFRGTGQRRNPRA